MNSSNEVIQWIKCDKCHAWLHLACTQPKLSYIHVYIVDNTFLIKVLTTCQLLSQ